jgi:hypothetical protein
MEETRVSGENHDLLQVTDKLYHKMFSRVHFLLFARRIVEYIKDRYIFYSLFTLCHMFYNSSEEH